MKAREVFVETYKDWVFDEDVEDAADFARDLATRLSAAGLAIVPREPTEEMVEVFWGANFREATRDEFKALLWRAMLKAYEEG